MQNCDTFLFFDTLQYLQDLVQKWVLIALHNIKRWLIWCKIIVHEKGGVGEHNLQKFLEREPPNSSPPGRGVRAHLLLLC